MLQECQAFHGWVWAYLQAYFARQPSVLELCDAGAVDLITNCLRPSVSCSAFPFVTWLSTLVNSHGMGGCQLWQAFCRFAITAQHA